MQRTFLALAIAGAALTAAVIFPGGGPLASPPRVLAAGPCASSGTPLDGEEQDLVARINAHRAANGAGALTVSPSLSRSATWMVTDMGTKNYFAHVDSLGRGPSERAADCGYPGQAGENIGAGTVDDTGAEAFALFRDSPPHNQNMLVPYYTVVGVARVLVPGSKYTWYWAVDFGIEADPGGGAASTAAPEPPPPATPTPSPAASAPPAATQPTQPSPTQPPAGQGLQPTPVPAGAPESLGLHRGLNQLAWALEPAAPTPVIGGVPVVAVYYYEEGSGEWLRYSPWLPGAANTLKLLERGKVYWFVMR
jgi:uncharacterized protein YkwD